MSSSADVLRAFLEHPDRPEGTLTFDQLRGFFFAVVNAPELIMPSDWIPAIFGDGKQTFANIEEANVIYQALKDEYNAVNEFSLMVVETEDGALVVRIEDDGTGFATDAPRKPHSFGLFGLRERASLMGGEVSIASAPGEGTRIEVRLPYAEPVARA